MLTFQKLFFTSCFHWYGVTDVHAINNSTSDVLIYDHIKMLPFHHVCGRKLAFVWKMKNFFPRTMQDRTFVSGHAMKYSGLEITTKKSLDQSVCKKILLWKVVTLSSSFQRILQHGTFVSGHMLICTMNFFVISTKTVHGSAIFGKNIFNFCEKWLI